jgi:hypothetical protein
MTRSFTTDVYSSPLSERAARALMNGGRAQSPRSAWGFATASAPVTPHVTTTARRFLAVDASPIVSHRGSWPSVSIGSIRIGGAGGCMCSCHGNGDSSGQSCDVPSCVEAVRV